MANTNKQAFGLHVVAVGHPLTNTAIIGPFKTGDDATEWASKNVVDLPWSIAPLEAPENY